MPDVTVVAPNIGTKAFFFFKEPINTYLKNKYNLRPSEIALKVVSIINMTDIIKNDLKDPYTEIYLPANISEVDYKKDLIDDVPVISFSYTNDINVKKYIRVPLNYIESYSGINTVEYINKLIVIDLNKLPINFDTTLFFNDLNDFIYSRVGINPNIKEVSIGDVELVSQDEHEAREIVRNNSITIYKSYSTRLEEITLKYDQLLARLQQLGISLG